MSEVTPTTIRRWVRGGIRTYEACVQEGMSDAEARDASSWAAVDSESREADRIVRSGIALYVNALDDGILAEDAKQAAVAVMSDIVMGEQMARRLRQNVEVDGRVYWHSPEVTVTKTEAVELIARLVERVAVAGSEFSFVFDGYVSREAGKDGSES